MTIHFTKDGVFADTEQEKLEFLDRLHSGDPVIAVELEIYRRELEEVDA